MRLASALTSSQHFATQSQIYQGATDQDPGGTIVLYFSNATAEPLTDADTIHIVIRNIRNQFKYITLCL